MKKVTLAAAVAALTFSAAFAQPGMGGAVPSMQASAHMQQKQMKQATTKSSRRGMKSVFLIQRGLPHYSMILMKLWDNPKLALTPEQKSRLKAIRTRTIGAVKELAPQVKQLRKKIVQGAKKGANPDTLAADVDKLAALKAKATKIQLACMAETEKVLTPGQIRFVRHYLKQMRSRHRNKQHAR